jgi:mannose-6-phosphate isomerase-like protein (cupin superfamily)
MRLKKADLEAKGWSVGPWNVDIDIAVGYATIGLDEPHLHTHLTELYLIARGESFIRIERETVRLQAGDVLVIEPGEAHMFLDSSPDYFHFVVHSPCLTPTDKVPVSRERLGLAGD